MYVLHLLVEVFIPHVIDCASCSSHKQSSHTEERKHAQIRKASRVSRQPNTPRTGQIQQPRSYKNTIYISREQITACLASKRTSWKTTHAITVSHELSSPMGLSSLINLRYGWTDAGAAFTIPAGVRLNNLLPLLWPVSTGGHILCLWSSLLLKLDLGWQKAVVMLSCCLLRLERRAEQICGRLLLTACGWSRASSLVDIIVSVELSWPTYSKRCQTCKAVTRFIVHLHSCADDGTMNLTNSREHNTQITDEAWKCQVEWIRLFLIIFCAGIL